MPEGTRSNGRGKARSWLLITAGSTLLYRRARPGRRHAASADETGEIPTIDLDLPE